MLLNELKKHFGFNEFRSGQEETVSSILKGENVLSILSTGAGKSLCYQLPAYITGGNVLIISPLISLMDDQVVQMKLNGEQNVAAIHSALSRNDKKHILSQLEKYQFIFCSPEFIYEDRNFEYFKKLSIQYIVLDEAHCLSEWGYDFRPHYALISKVTDYFKSSQVIALTATLTKKMKNDIFQITNRTFTVHQEKLNRQNIMYHHFDFESDEEKDEWLLNEINYSGPTIIYVSSKKKCHELAKKIYDKGYLTGIYHGDLDYIERTTVQSQFIQNEIRIIVATSAFGMGINKKDVRTIIHYHLPTSPSRYIQEVGRAGRDGNPSQAISMFTERDMLLLNHIAHEQELNIELLNMFLEGYQLPEEVDSNIKSLLTLYTMDELKDIIANEERQKAFAFQFMQNYIHTDKCRRTFLLSYFDEEIHQESNCCDNCSNASFLKIQNIKHVKHKMDYKERLKAIFY